VEAVTDRRREIDRRINERYLTAAAQREASRGDALYHLNIEMLRQMFSATEEALAAEGVSEEVRDRIAYRLLYGEAPESYASPDFREAHNRMVDRDAAILRKMTEAVPVFRPEEWTP
jgi:hypothetical protein